MKVSKVIATVSRCVQIGESDFKQHRVSRAFSVDSTIYEILKFAEDNGVKNPTINDIELSVEA